MKREAADQGTPSPAASRGRSCHSAAAVAAVAAAAVHRNECRRTAVAAVAETGGGRVTIASQTEDTPLLPASQTPVAAAAVEHSPASWPVCHL